MDIEALRKEYLAEIQAAEAPAALSAKAVADYVDSEQPDEARLCEMIATLPVDRDHYEQGLRTLLDILGNEGLGIETRLCALRQLNAAEFEPVEFGPFHPEFIDLLRRLALHADRKIRLAALERLTLTNDPEAQKLLRESLEKDGKTLIPDAKAIQLLARDDHSSDLPTFRTLAANATGPVREQALRALANDSRSASLFEALASDKDEKISIRSIAQTNLKNTSTPRYAAMARKLVLDDEEDDKLRAAAVSAITHTKAIADRVVTPRFASKLESLASSTKSRSLKSSIRRFSRMVGGK
jgi:HEAT repeat protein